MYAICVLSFVSMQTLTSVWTVMGTRVLRDVPTPLEASSATAILAIGSAETDTPAQVTMLIKNLLYVYTHVKGQWHEDVL